MRTYSEVTPKRAPGYSHVLPAAMHVTTCMGQWWHRPHLFLNATNEPQKQSHLCRPRPQQGQQIWEQHLHQNQPQPDGRVTFQNHRMVSFQTSGHSDSVIKNLLSLSSHGGQRHWWQWQREATCQDPAVNVHLGSALCQPPRKQHGICNIFLFSRAVLLPRGSEDVSALVMWGDPQITHLRAQTVGWH